MYPISQAYADKLHSGVIRRRIRGSVDNIAFTEDDIVGGTFTYNEKCVKSDDIALGGVFVGEFTCSFLPAFASRISRGSWRDRVITFSIGLLVEDTWVDIPCKPYRIDEAMHSKTGVEVTAYDNMHAFDKNFNTSTTTGTLYDMASLACQACGVPLGMTAEQMAALPNGDQVLSVWLTNDIETWRDFISWIAVTACGFATINRAGALEIRTWHSEPDLSLDINDRYTGGKWSDFVTYYTGLSIVNMEDEVTEYISVTPDTGLTMKLGSNPLMQYGTKETKTAQRMAILEALQNFVFTPFSSSGLIDPCLDLGDVIEYTDGLAGDSSVCCVHAMSFKYSRGMSLKGYGKNPAMSDARSKTDKNISGLLSRQDESQIVTHTYMNSAEINLAEDTRTSIIKIRFASINAKIIKLLSEIQLDTTITDEDGIITAKVYYYLDNDLLSFSPVTTWDNDGKHILNLLYWLQNLEGGRQYTWEVALELNGGTAVIDKEWIHGILEAQGLVATEEWDGLVEAEDIITAHTGGSMHALGISESIEFEEHDVEKITANDVITAHTGGSMHANIVGENVDIYMQKNIYDIQSADEQYQIGSADGDWYLGSAE